MLRGHICYTFERTTALLQPPIPVSGGSSLLSGFLNESDKLIGSRDVLPGLLYFPPFLPPTPGNTKWQEECLPNHYPVKPRFEEKAKATIEVGGAFESRNGPPCASEPLEKPLKKASVKGQSKRRTEGRSTAQNMASMH